MGLLSGVGVLVPNTLVIRMVTSMFLGFSPLKKRSKMAVFATFRYIIRQILGKFLMELWQNQLLD